MRRYFLGIDERHDSLLKKLAKIEGQPTTVAVLRRAVYLGLQQLALQDGVRA